ncbi:PREDICTED: uncharacterized protein LOC104015334, partial [Nipponia nippon]|uniref:uncharacterized protein LOC104015334 n=1 Tax=Nipponia nippon TaxID=128390 RepID=UPI0005113C28
IRLRVRAEYCEHESALRRSVASSRPRGPGRQLDVFGQASGVLKSRDLGSILCDIKFSELSYLDAFWGDYLNGSLLEALKGVFLTEGLRRAVGREDVRLLVSVDQDDYEEGRGLGDARRTRVRTRVYTWVHTRVHTWVPMWLHMWVYTWIYTWVRPYVGVYVGVYAGPYVRVRVCVAPYGAGGRPVRTWVHTCVYTWVHTWVHTRVYMWVYTWIYTWVYTQVRTWVYTWVYTRVHTCVYASAWPRMEPVAAGERSRGAREGRETYSAAVRLRRDKGKAVGGV